MGIRTPGLVIANDALQDFQSRRKARSCNRISLCLWIDADVGVHPFAPLAILESPLCPEESVLNTTERNCFVR